MSTDATLIASQLQDIVASLSDVAGALRDVTPVVNVDVAAAPTPQVTLETPAPPAPIVNVSVPEGPAPIVNVEPTPVTLSSQIVVPPSPASAYAVRITERDENGLILAFVITPA